MLIDSAEGIQVGESRVLFFHVSLHTVKRDYTASVDKSYSESCREKVLSRDGFMIRVAFAFAYLLLDKEICL